MKTPQALLTAIAAAALSFAIVIGTAVTLASESDAATTSAHVAWNAVAVSAQQMALVAQTDAAGWNADCEIAL
jgi:uncharacterized protein (DUF849 family)